MPSQRLSAGAKCKSISLTPLKCLLRGILMALLSSSLPAFTTNYRPIKTTVQDSSGIHGGTEAESTKPPAFANWDLQSLINSTRKTESGIVLFTSLFYDNQ